MARPALEVADILRDQGPAWHEANRGHVSLDQLKVMSAIERCRSAALGGHVARCENAACGHTEIAYNSCRNRHCPKCQGAASRRWLADREAELLPVPYFHVVYTLPSKLRDIAYQNKRVVYDLLMKAAAETTLAIATDPKRLGASCCTCYPRASSASATTGSLPPSTAPRASRRPAHCSISPRLPPTRKSSGMSRRTPHVYCPAHARTVAAA
jgi:Transposase zinc-binding domain